MTSLEILLEPSTTFSCALFSATYSPSGLIFSIAPLLLSWLVYLRTTITSNFFVILYIIVSTSTIYHLHKRISLLEQAPTSPPCHSDAHTIRILGVLHTLIRLHNVTRIITDEGFDTLRTEFRGMLMQLENDMTAMDNDLVLHTTHINILRKCMGVLENNVDTARCILGQGFQGSEDGLEMGDDVEMFWHGSGDETDECDEEVQVEEINVGASDELVEKWLDESLWPEECENA